MIRYDTIIQPLNNFSHGMELVLQKYWLLLMIPLLAVSLGPTARAQQPNGLSSEVELGAIFTTGNTENESINFRGEVDWRREAWEYGFLLDGFRASQNDLRTAQRVYYVADAHYDINERSFVLTRLAHEEDQFSGYDSQSDISVNYGHNLLTDRENMTLTLNLGLGARSSRSQAEDFDEVIGRLAADYAWAISPTASLGQRLSTESGNETSIFRSESSIETRILDNLSLRFSIGIKHQTAVPVGRQKTDTETTISLVMSF